MNHYELMLIFTPNLEEKGYLETMEFYAGFLKQNKANIVHQNPWGLRTLQYPIRKKTTGFYWVIEYEAQGDLNAKLLQQFSRDERVLRHMITVLDHHAIAYNERKRQPRKLEDSQAQ